MPLLFAAVAAADVESQIAGGRGAVNLLLEEIGYGVLGGILAGALIAAIVVYAGRRDLIACPWRQVIPAAGAGLAYGIAFLLFGAILLEPVLGELSWGLVLYALLSLTIVRMAPVAVAMLGSGARAQTLGFLGWFGPRGLASIVFAVGDLRDRSG